MRRQREMFEKAPEKKSEDGPLTRDQARSLTDKILKAADGLGTLLLEAYDRGAWTALGYGSWREYAMAELSLSQSAVYRKLTKARVSLALGEAAGISGPEAFPEVGKNGDGPHTERWYPGQDTTRGIEVSEQAAEEIQGRIGEVAAEVKKRVKKGEKPAAAVKAAVSGARKKTPKPKKPKPAAGPSEFSPDMAREFERSEKENERLSAVIETLKSGKVEKEYAKLSEQYARLEGRLQQSLRTVSEATKEAKYCKGVLAKVRRSLKVEKNEEILEAIADLKR